MPTYLPNKVSTNASCGFKTFSPARRIVATTATMILTTIIPPDVFRAPNAIPATDAAYTAKMPNNAAIPFFFFDNTFSFITFPPLFVSVFGKLICFVIVLISLSYHLDIVLSTALYIFFCICYDKKVIVYISIRKRVNLCRVVQKSQKIP